MSIESVYITSTGSFLPNDPVDNEGAERVLGRVHGRRCPLRRRVQKNNGIETRHYALDESQQTTHQNEELASSAIEGCLERSGLGRGDVGMLAVATTQGDLAIPGLASMVHGRLKLPPCEILTTHGVCSSGMMALKAAWNSLRLGEHGASVVCASELSSRQLKASRYEASRTEEEGARTDMDSAFLRWMLSDGAGAVLLQRAPAKRGLSLRIDWVKVLSFADSFPVCMYAGRSTREGARASWMDYESAGEAERHGAMLLRQDIRLLDNIVKLGVMGFLRLIREGHIDASEIDHFLCHYSSHYFRGPIVKMLTMSGAMIPEERWFTNLYTKGNSGCAAIFIILDEFFQRQEMKAGETVFCFVPESGRFSTAYMRLTVVDAGG